MRDFTTIYNTTPSVAGIVPAPVHIRIDGTEARSTDLRIKRDTAVMARVREIYAQAYEANESMRLRLSRS